MLFYVKCQSFDANEEKLMLAFLITKNVALE